MTQGICGHDAEVLEERLPEFWAAYLRLEEADQVVIERCMWMLSKRVGNMGFQSAFELLGKLGVFFAKHDEVKKDGEK